VTEKKRKKQKKVTKPRRKGEIMAGGPQSNPGAGAASCKIKPIPSGFQMKASDMPVTINLCSDATGKTLSTAVQFVTVDVFDDVTSAPIPGQPNPKTANTFVLTLKAGKYRIDMVVEALVLPKPKAYVFEACNNPTAQLCFFNTAVSPECAFRLEVI
jgi:hypothetical protein